MTKKKYLHKIGEISLNTKGLLMTITQYHKHNNIEVIFQDGVKAYNINYSRFKEGRVAKPVSRIGEKFTTNEGYEIEIVEYLNSMNVTVKFQNGTIIKNRQYSAIEDGRVHNPIHLSKYGIGYMGEGKYKAEVSDISTRHYVVWDGIIRRCYNEKERTKFPTYADCTVASEWHNFQNFAQWFENNYKEDFHLDKDILFKGNKIYSPETCAFVPQEINGLFTKNDARRGDYPIGVHFDNTKKKFVSQLAINGGSLHLGYFTTPEEAFQAYKIAKESYIKEVAEKWKPLITKECYQALINYKVEITD